jgi:hypothetical protein
MQSGGRTYGVKEANFWTMNEWKMKDDRFFTYGCNGRLFHLTLQLNLSAVYRKFLMYQCGRERGWRRRPEAGPMPKGAEVEEAWSRRRRQRITAAMDLSIPEWVRVETADWRRRRVQSIRNGR